MYPSAVLLVMLLASPLPALGPDQLSAQADDDDRSVALNAWMPPDDPGTWAVSESFDTTEEQRAPCTAGHVTRWTGAAGQTAGMVWAECGTAETAAAMLNSTWAANGMYPAADVAPVFGEGLDLTSPYSAGFGLSRLWTQGGFFLSIARSCDPADLAGCAELTARDARNLADLVGLPLNPVVEVARLPDDLLADWAPPDDNSWRLASTATLGGDDLARCEEGVSADWTGADGGRLQAYWVRCASTPIAFAFQKEKWAGLADLEGLRLVFGAPFDRVSRYTDANGVIGVTRSWVQGDLYVNVQRTCPQGDASVCADSTASYVPSISRMLPGDVTEDTTLMAAVIEAGWLFFAVPILTFLALIVPQRVRSWLRSRGYSVDTDNPAFTSVDRLVRRVRISRIARRVLLTVAVIVAWWFGFFAFANTGLWQLLYAFVAPFLFYAVIGLVLRLVWRPHPVIRMARRSGRPTLLGGVGMLIRGMALMLAALTLMVYAFASLLLITDRTTVTPATVDSQIAQGFQEPTNPALIAYQSIRWLVHQLDQSGTYALVFVVMLVAPIFLAYLIDRFGQRLARKSLTLVLQDDNRPYFLYLRGFDEDRLRSDESVGRQGFLEIFTPFGRPRFEEVLVQYLNQFGPVIAISANRKRLSDLGAAKISLGGDAWQDQVREWASGARAVVMSATPGEVRRGLEWEMSHVASREDGVRLMLVVAPWPRAELARRWTGFLARASQWQLFADLVERPMPSGVEVLTWSRAKGWRGYGARRRWDWSYAASIITAMRSGDLDLPDEAARAARKPERAEA